MSKDERVGAANARGVTQQAGQGSEFGGKVLSACCLRGGACWERIDPFLHSCPHIGNRLAGRKLGHGCQRSTLVVGSKLRGRRTCAANTRYW